ncbi:MAG TPA: tripartite tricarboxylate transporter substrate-binding protein, partial [Casimicrobiaceae bacterium]|nr:tripartite tricarboxylate transporter substrate-binding protein [Casimicrobiaceae bacterium]
MPRSHCSFLARLASLAGIALALSIAPPAVQGQTAPFPAKPVRLVVPFPPGGPLDVTGRAIAQKLGETWAQSVVVDNRPGAGGNIGADLVAKSPPDGYTVVMGALSTHAVNPSLYPSMPYDAVRDFAPITLVAVTPNVLVVNPALPVRSVQELVAYAKANPGKLSYGSSGTGGSPHLATLLFDKYAGIQMTHVPYKGIAPALTDLLGGQIDFALLTPITIVSYLGSDKMRIIGITAPVRHPMLPD